MVKTRSQLNAGYPTRSKTSVHTVFKSLNNYEVKKRKSQKQPIPQTSITVKELPNIVIPTIKEEISILEAKPSMEENDQKEEDNEDNQSISSEMTTIEDLLAYKDKIDFEEASQEWCANKKRNAQNMWVYICGKPLKNGKKCMRAQCDKVGFYSGCKQHYAWEEKEHYWLGDFNDPILASSDSSLSTL